MLGHLQACPEGSRTRKRRRGMTERYHDKSVVERPWPVATEPSRSAIWIAAGQISSSGKLTGHVTQACGSTANRLFP